MTAALAAAAVGCGGADGGEGGKAVTIYVSAPLHGSGSADGADISDGARMALIDAGGRPDGDSVGGVEVGGARVDVSFLDDSSGSKRFDQVRTAANARRASEDSSAIAYIGELDSGATRVSLPITNQAGILQVSPGSGSSELVRAEPFNDDVPTDVQTSGKRTFAALVPSDEDQGRAAADWVDKAIGRPSLIVEDGSAFGDELSAGFQAERPGARPVGGDAGSGSPAGCEQSSAQARMLAGARKPAGAAPTAGRPVTNPVVYLAAEPRCGIRAAAILAAAGFQAIPMASDAMITTAGLKAMQRVGIGGIVTAAAPKPVDLPGGGDFPGRFRSRFGRDPGRYAAFGYEAMASVLDAIDRSGDATDRDSVVGAYLDGSERDSVIGRYSLDAVGQPDGLDVALYAIDPGGALGPEPSRPGPVVAP